MDNVVEEKFSCTNCGENRIDYLVIDEVGKVDCQSCGNKYFL